MKYVTLLFEIGTEELPAGYVIPALDLLVSSITVKMASLRIEYGRTHVYGTPRRLAVMINDVASKQTDLAETLTGPPVKVAIDTDGNYTVPALKFAEKTGVPVTSLKTVTTDKGEYLAADRVEKGQPTGTVLKEVLPQILSSMTFPKNMKWGEQKVLFARPVRSILALFGKSVVSFSWADIKSGRYTSGHPFMSPRRIKIDHPDDYLDCLQKAYVIVDINTRRKWWLMKSSAYQDLSEGRYCLMMT